MFCLHVFWGQIDVDRNFLLGGGGPIVIPEDNLVHVIILLLQRDAVAREHLRAVLDSPLDVSQVRRLRSEGGLGLALVRRGG